MNECCSNIDVRMLLHLYSSSRGDIGFCCPQGFCLRWRSSLYVLLVLTIMMMMMMRVLMQHQYHAVDDTETIVCGLIKHWLKQNRYETVKYEIWQSGHPQVPFEVADTLLYYMWTKTTLYQIKGIPEDMHTVYLNTGRHLNVYPGKVVALRKEQATFIKASIAFMWMGCLCCFTPKSIVWMNQCSHDEYNRLLPEEAVKWMRFGISLPFYKLENEYYISLTSIFACFECGHTHDMDIKS